MLRCSGLIDIVVQKNIKGHRRSCKNGYQERKEAHESGEAARTKPAEPLFDGGWRQRELRDLCLEEDHGQVENHGTAQE